MRFFTRFYALIGAAFCCALYIAWVLPSLKVPARAQRLWTGQPRRLVVFGDAWSDDGVYPMKAPLEGPISPTDAKRGKVWTQWLSSSLHAQHDNYARALADSYYNNSYDGAVVDNDRLMRLRYTNDTTAEQVPDLKSQVEHWLSVRETFLSAAPEKLVDERNSTVFALFFGIWDIWHFSSWDDGPAEMAIDNSIDVIFESLDIIAKEWDGPVKAIMPQAIDPTLLPAWKAVRTNVTGICEGSDVAAEEQRRAISLTTRWNKNLAERSRKWNGGRVFIFDTNEWLVAYMRDYYMWWRGESDMTGRGKGDPEWDEALEPCLSVGRHNNATNVLSLRKKKKCDNPEKYLFWDETQLTGAAHQKLAEVMSKDVDALFDAKLKRM
ncbi:hypothetical protein L228DRAFT_31344 [Xylona heveae TC161]|uniref:Uncharacterized protein n=1 Tax=Xylona heveae (strain CBS 132557 / TC161) TaxID=1328760 RepID=A0A165A3X3_XYLHT|nr:hypothetical protein L228DRAFT_31344 [Xylona heveae TC161]KZF19916.1 hypothetical protein L228DRAFT_31344 [Xylona heveae TC161]